MGPLEGKMPETPSSETISTKLQRIANQSRRVSNEALTTLSHYIDLQWLHEAFRRTRKDGAVGVDGQTGEQYAENLESNLQSLLDRAKSGAYRAPAVRRSHVPKGEGSKTRPIGIPTFEDKVLQRAVAMVVEAVYEPHFLPFSYGFRPGRSAHQALDAMWKGLMDFRGGWVLKLDIQSFFDELDHRHLQEMLRRRVRDGVLLRLIGKWLKAGVLEDGAWHRNKAGSPQGGVASPLLANIYLHEVFDLWFEQIVRPRLRGRAFAIRFADDIALVFANEEDARRVLAVLPKRFGRYSLSLHPEKTHLIEFRPGVKGPKQRRSIDLLGFTLYWGRSRQGNWVVRRKTAKDRLRRSLHRVHEWCRRHRHWPVEVQHRHLVWKLNGHYAYFGVTGNSPAMHRYWHGTKRAWRRWLNRRSQRARMNWERFNLLLARYPLPPPRVVHSVYRRAANP
jgi:group II intron reverse transcriptase/maturase